jgi:hypothetical protein
MRKQNGKQSLRTNATAKNEPIFLQLLKDAGLPVPAKEVVMAKGRRFRIDYAWEECRLGIEIQGGVFTRGAHGSIYGILSGYKKSNVAAEHGWTLMYFLPSEMHSMETINQIKRAFQWKQMNG